MSSKISKFFFGGIVCMILSVATLGKHLTGTADLVLMAVCFILGGFISIGF